MRLKSFMCGLALLATAALAIAQAQPAKQPAEKAAAAAPAASSKAKKYGSSTTTIGTLLADPAAKAILVKHVPDLLKSDHLEQMSGMTLKDMQQAVAAYNPNFLSDKVLAEIDQEFATLPVKAKK